ncbi:MAG TPA: hypothetical protein PJ994_12945 [Tepidiformaceae bacterium]|nr:hypothetical protein [Tepidiformaceae bacterium]
MFYHPSALNVLAPAGDPSPEALYREEFITAKPRQVSSEPAIDHRAAACARSIRAQVAARVGSFFTIA